MKPSRIILAGLCAALPNLACAPVPGEGRFVRIASEEAIIIWDEGAQRQHFIRRASFDTDAKDFGFLVPTPNRPELAEAGNDAFAFLAAITLPFDRAARGKSDEAAKPAGPRPAAVTVLEQKVVAGYDAAVLEATDAKALDGWLKQHGYPSSPQLVAWYEPYIAGKWKITAFKISADAPKVASSAVRMSFQTEKPFFPYREPASQGTAGKQDARLLRVYFLADARFTGTVGANGAWDGRAVWSNNVEKEDVAYLLKLARLPSLAGGGGRWLTEFEDRSSPRPGTDEVFFQRAADQTTLGRPAPVPVMMAIARSNTYQLSAAAVGIAALIIVALLVYKRRRRGNRRLFG
ncbi:MAG TPA: DUF2330 domain-containing protein [Burkholderiales bacterium]|nr:DUF2330 domain-containing protein [Burkholderiales bacterium]